MALELGHEERCALCAATLVAYWIFNFHFIQDGSVVELEPVLALPEISVSLAPPPEPVVEPFSPFPSQSPAPSADAPVDDGYRPNLLSPPATASPRSPAAGSTPSGAPSGPARCSIGSWPDTGRAIEPRPISEFRIPAGKQAVFSFDLKSETPKSVILFPSPDPTRPRGPGRWSERRRSCWTTRSS